LDLLQADAEVDKLIAEDLSFHEYIDEVTKYRELAEEISYNSIKVC